MSAQAIRWIGWILCALIAGLLFAIISVHEPRGKDGWFPSPAELIGFFAMGLLAVVAALGMLFEIILVVARSFIEAKSTHPTKQSRYVMKSVIIAAAMLVPALLIADDTPFSLDRLIHEARSQDAWKTATTASAKLNQIREVALKKDVVSDPVSDRYLITALGGPIDMVHFLGLAVPVCAGSLQREAALLDQWEREGGADFEAGRTATYPTEAHPDDLPSNAFGALFGEEIRDHENDPSFDVVAALKAFLSPLEPLPDAIAKKFSHRVIVMGLREDSSFKTSQSRSEWFTATPLFSLYAIDPNRAKALGGASSALRKAGFQVRSIDGKPILIERTSVQE